MTDRPFLPPKHRRKPCLNVRVPAWMRTANSVRVRQVGSRFVILCDGVRRRRNPFFRRIIRLFRVTD